MKISDVQSVVGMHHPKSIDGAEPEAQSPKDRVSVQASKDAEAAIAVAHRAAGSSRAARAEKLEAQVRSGGYHPDPGRVAEQILADAMVDARLSALLRR